MGISPVGSNPWLRSETWLITGDARQTCMEEQVPFRLMIRPHVFGM